MHNAENVDLDLEPEPDPPVLEAAGDPAAEAFARLEGELALMRRAVQHLAAERADIVIPDYGATLIEMAKRLGEIDECLEDMADHPAMQMTPDSLGSRIAIAAEAARRSDHDRITEARNDLHHATQEARNVTAHARTAADQRQRLLQAVGGGMLAGIMLWSFLPGAIARAMPESWHWPERMAAQMVGQDTPWSAGIRMMRTADPVMWDAIVQASRIEQENREIIAGCVKNANGSGQTVRCSVKVPPMRK